MRGPLRYCCLVTLSLQHHDGFIKDIEVGQVINGLDIPDSEEEIREWGEKNLAEDAIAGSLTERPGDQCRPERTLGRRHCNPCRRQSR